MKNKNKKVIILPDYLSTHGEVEPDEKKTKLIAIIYISGRVNIMI